MDIIVRRVLKGFRARFNSHASKFGELGRTRGEAIGNLILRSHRKVGIKHVSWDKKDKLTRKYANGWVRHKTPPWDTSQLPSVVSPEEARKMQIESLHLSSRLSSTLAKIFSTWMGRYKYYPLTLGDVCNCTEKELRAKLHPIHPGMGPKTSGQLHELLKHYGLSLKMES